MRHEHADLRADHGASEDVDRDVVALHDPPNFDERGERKAGPP